MKIILVLLICFSFLSSDLLKSVKAVEIEDVNTKIEYIKNNEFKEVSLPFIKHTDNAFFVKVVLDKNHLKRNDLLEFYSEFNLITFENNIEFTDTFQNKTINFITDRFSDTIYLKIHNTESYVNFNINRYDAKDYISKQSLKNILFGISYGIIFCAFLYYLILYIFNRNKSYIYYSLMQAVVLPILFITSLSESSKIEVLMDSLIPMFFISAALFTKTFLNTKKFTPTIDKMINIYILILIIDFISYILFDNYVITSIIPSSIFMILFILAALIVLFKGFKPAVFYLLGWGLMIGSFIFVQLQFYFTNLAVFDSVYLLHIIVPLESLILAFALSYKIKLLELEKNTQQEYVIHQNKLASMGEMLASIAHQWRQPLSNLSYLFMNIKTAHKTGKLSDEYFEKKSKEIGEHLNFMSNTIDDFRNFYLPKKEKEKFAIKECYNQIENMIFPILQENNITLEIEGDDFYIEGYKSELSQVLLNLITNAKDSLIKDGIQTPKITVILGNKEVIVKDNGKKIEKELQNKIFEPFFSTKEEGSGIGLYMSKQIIEKHFDAKLYYKVCNGNCFIINFQ